MNPTSKDERTKISFKGRFGLENYFIPLWYLGIVALTFVLSLFTIGFDFARLSTGTYWGNMAVNYCLSIVSLMAATKDGSDKGKRKASYQKARDSLESAIQTVHERGISFLLSDYLAAKYELDRKAFIKETLSLNAIDPKYLEMDTKTLRKNRRKFDLSGDQLNILCRLKKGKYKVRQISTSDLFSEKSAAATMNLGPAYNMSKRQLDLSLPRMVMMLVISALFASVGIDAAQQSGITTAINLVVRLFTIATSIASGYMNGFTVDRELEVVYAKREDILRVFMQKLDSGEYVPPLKEGARLPAVEVEESEPEKPEEDEYEIIEVTAEEAEKLLNKDNSPDR